jgi:hypothetical protein
MALQVMPNKFELYVTIGVCAMIHQYVYCCREVCCQILYCIALSYSYIYIGVPLHNPREGDCTGAGGLTTQTALVARSDRLGWRRQGNPKTPRRPTRVEPLMDRAKPHVGGGLESMYLEYNTFSNTPAVKTLASANTTKNAQVLI